ncbi:MAG: ATP-binding protein [Candidatus Hydrogenedentota bacterium]|nr:MAG: ATP-binding protein [Candidatus Hydrogenedentota bacterium]
MEQTQLDPFSPWLEELNEALFAGTSAVGILYGNTRDIIPDPMDGESSRLSKLLFEEYEKKFHTIVSYDLQSGIRFFREEDQRNFLTSLEAYDAFHGTNFSNNIPREPMPAFSILHSYLQKAVLENKSTLLIVQYAELLFPQLETSFHAEARYLWTTLDKWSSHPIFIEKQIRVLLIARHLSDLNQSLVRSPYVFTVEIPQPNFAARKMFTIHQLKKYSNITNLQADYIAKNTAGLSLIALEQMFLKANAQKEKITVETIKERKKDFIEQECAGLLEFLEPKFNLSHVAGHKAAKEKFKKIIQLIRQNKTEYLPMGYLICGPVGTGKTFLVEAVAGEIGIPVVKFRNFRSQWVGATESNLEIIIGLLKTAYPIAVVIDEADAMLGNRQMSGDSGTSQRVFASLAAFMSDTKYRGKIHWFLMTSRPDLLPVDLKRQGRAEEHIPLFYPESDEEKQEFMHALGRKNGIATKHLYFRDPYQRGLSGADIEAILIRAAREAMIQEQDKISQELLNHVIQNFLSPQYQEDIDRQKEAAIRECTDKSLLPEGITN